MSLCTAADIIGPDALNAIIRWCVQPSAGKGFDRADRAELKNIFRSLKSTRQSITLGPDIERACLLGQFVEALLGHAWVELQSYGRPTREERHQVARVIIVAVHSKTAHVSLAPTPVLTSFPCARVDRLSASRACSTRSQWRPRSAPAALSPPHALTASAPPSCATDTVWLSSGLQAHPSRQVARPVHVTEPPPPITSDLIEYWGSVRGRKLASSISLASSHVSVVLWLARKLAHDNPLRKHHPSPELAVYLLGIQAQSDPRDR